VRWFKNLLSHHTARHNLQDRFEQLEFDLEEAVEDLDEALQELQRSYEEVNEVRDLLKEAQLARQQLELDLVVARALRERAEALAAKFAGRCADLASELAQLKRPRPRDARGHFIKGNA
jgi:chromosome segregation ATPase